MRSYLFRPSRRHQRGFTLLELAIALIIIGVLLTLTDMAGIVKINKRNYIARQEVINKNIAAVLTQYAKTSTTLGRLPTPYTGGGYFSTVLNPANSTLAGMFTAANVAPSEINTDGTSGANVRVYQLIERTQSTPLEFQSGPLVTLTYDYAEVHQTACQFSNGSCNVSPRPTSTTALTTGNFATWTTSGTDLKPEFFSTLPLQQQMLTLTAQRIIELRDRFNAHHSSQLLAATAGSTTNFFPFPYQTGVPATPDPDMSGAAAATNQGCWDGWYNLNSASVNLLAQLGLTQSQYGTTAWGGQIEYCRDYDPALRGAGTSPHYAAIRIHQSVSTGVAPDTTAALTSANNVYLSF